MIEGEAMPPLDVCLAGPDLVSPEQIPGINLFFHIIQH